VKKPRFDQSQNFSVRVVHSSVSDVVERAFTGQTVWKTHSGAFDWKISRPETGVGNHSMLCPYCGKLLEMNIASISEINAFRKTHRKVRNIGGVASLVIAVAMAVMIIIRVLGAERMDSLDITIGLTGIPLVIFLVVLLVGLSGSTGDMDGIKAQGELSEQALTGPSSQHYIEKNII
jgi:hypothetical protein